MDDHPDAPPPHGRLSIMRAVVIPLLIVVATAVVIQSFVLRPYEIPTGSMEPAIQPGDRVLVNQLIYRMRDVERGDIVVFDPPPAVKISCDIPQADRTPFVKRVIGIGGDKVSMTKDGDTTVNGEPVIIQGQSANWTSATWTVPEGSVFVLGDNRVNSCDSSHWTEPFVPVANITGSVQMRYWPPSSIGPT